MSETGAPHGLHAANLPDNVTLGHLPPAEAIRPVGGMNTEESVAQARAGEVNPATEKATEKSTGPTTMAAERKTADIHSQVAGTFNKVEPKTPGPDTA